MTIKTMIELSRVMVSSSGTSPRQQDQTDQVSPVLRGYFQKTMRACTVLQMFVAMLSLHAPERWFEVDAKAPN